MADKTSVLIVSTSAVVRQFIARALCATAGIEVIGTLANPAQALERMRSQQPNVLIVDSEMPRLDCLSFVRRIVAQQPTPVIACAARAGPGTQKRNEILASGAVAIIDRPNSIAKGPADSSSGDIVRAVRSAARSGVRRTGTKTSPPRSIAPKWSADVMLSADYSAAHPPHGSERIVAIGTSTGGTQALEAILTRLPAISPGLIIVQHMPEMFTAMFAERLDSISTIAVREARNGDRVRPGLALIAPGGKHMMLKGGDGHYVVEVIDGPLVNRHRPSVDVLFRSVAKYAGAGALGIIMTGMGDDGARGLLEMHDAGARTIAQDEASCVVFGMPNEAIKLGAVDFTLPLKEIPAAIESYRKGGQ